MKGDEMTTFASNTDNVSNLTTPDLEGGFSGCGGDGLAMTSANFNAVLNWLSSNISDFENGSGEPDGEPDGMPFYIDNNTNQLWFWNGSEWIQAMNVCNLEELTQNEVDGLTGEEYISLCVNGETKRTKVSNLVTGGQDFSVSVGSDQYTVDFGITDNGQIAFWNGSEYVVQNGVMVDSWSSDDGQNDALSSGSIDRTTFAVEPLSDSNEIFISYDLNVLVDGIVAGPGNAPIVAAQVLVDGTLVAQRYCEIEVDSATIEEKGYMVAQSNLRIPAWTGSKDVVLRATYVAGDIPAEITASSLLIKEYSAGQTFVSGGNNPIDGIIIDNGFLKYESNGAFSYVSGQLLQSFVNDDSANSNLSSGSIDRTTFAVEPLSDGEIHVSYDLNVLMDGIVAGPGNAPIVAAQVLVDGTLVAQRYCEIEVDSATIEEKGYMSVGSNFIIPAWTGSKDVVLRATYVAGDIPAEITASSLLIKEYS